MIKSLALAIALLYSANNTVQQAIDVDFCKNNSMIATTAARGALGKADAKAYDKIDKALGRAYAKVPATDAELEHVLKKFCAAVDNR